ncbi:MAG: methyltransferase domain-containing protein [Deltaproteobacteria bacterium]|nr:methyltransferase domain-containing protein [Deltaproteobacteria bacterium]MDH4122015.1 methyltransferase domain-containing protein [Deltaproteobacteria bacterium]
MAPDKIWARINARPVRVLVDVGAGIGFYAIPFSRRMAEQENRPGENAPPGLVVALDIQGAMIPHLKQAVRAEKAPGVAVLQAAGERLPLIDGSADVLLMANLFHELADPQAALEEAQRVLAPGGRLAVIDWRTEPTPKGPPLDIRIAERQAAEMMVQAGFRHVQSHGVLPYHWFLLAEM